MGPTCTRGPRRSSGRLAGLDRILADTLRPPHRVAARKGSLPGGLLDPQHPICGTPAARGRAADRTWSLATRPSAIPTALAVRPPPTLADPRPPRGRKGMLRLSLQVALVAL